MGIGELYLRRLRKQTDGSRKSQAEGGETDSGVDRQDEPGPSLQQGEPGGGGQGQGQNV